MEGEGIRFWFNVNHQTFIEVDGPSSAAVIHKFSSEVVICLKTIWQKRGSSSSCRPNVLTENIPRDGGAEKGSIEDDHEDKDTKEHPLRGRARKVKLRRLCTSVLEGHVAVGEVREKDPQKPTRTVHIMEIKKNMLVRYSVKGLGEINLS